MLFGRVGLTASRTAGGRDDVIHPKILDHLSVVIVGMPVEDRNGFDPGTLSGGVERIRGQLHQILIRQRSHGPVRMGERVFHVFDDVVFAGEVVRPVVVFLRRESTRRAKRSQPY